MKTISKYRIFNKYNVISFTSMLLILWISWAFASYFIEIITMDYYAEDLAISTKEEADNARYQFIIGILTWERYIDSAMRYIVYIFPLFSLLTVLPFCDELNGYYSYPARFKNYSKSLINGILCHSFIGGITISAVFFVFFSVGTVFMVPQIENIGGYASILPDDFYYQHPYLFFLFMSFTIYFAIGFVFSLLGCSIALVTRKKHHVIIIPMLLYLCDAYILGGVLGLYKYQIFGSVCAFNTVYSTFENFIPLLPFFIISILIILIYNLKQRNTLKW